MTEARPFLRRGEPAPWFRAQAIGGSPSYTFHTVAGRHVLMLFLGAAQTAEASAALALVQSRRAMFDDERACFFGITRDPADAAEGRVAPSLPGIRFFLDESGEVSRLYGALADDGAYRPFWLLLDPALRSLALLPIERGAEAIAALTAAVQQPRGDEWAPVLSVPNVFEPDLCRRLIALYVEEGGAPSGFMREVDGKTVLLTDPSHKLRIDCSVDDPHLRALLLDAFLPFLYDEAAARQREANNPHLAEELGVYRA